MLFGERAMEVLTRELINQLLQAGMAEHTVAEPRRGERIEQGRGYRNGSYKHLLNTRVASPEPEVPRDREGSIGILPYWTRFFDAGQQLLALTRRYIHCMF